MQLDNSWYFKHNWLILYTTCFYVLTSLFDIHIRDLTTLCRRYEWIAMKIGDHVYNEQCRLDIGKYASYRWR